MTKNSKKQKIFKKF